MSAEFVPKLEHDKLEETTSETTTSVPTTSETNAYSKIWDDYNPLLYSVKEEIVDYKQEEPSNNIIRKEAPLGEISGMYTTYTIAVDADGVKVELCPINNTYDVVKDKQSMIDNDRVGEIEENLDQVSKISSQETDLISNAEIVHPPQDQSCSIAEVYVEHYTVPGPVKKKSSPPKPSLQCLFCDVTFQNKGGLKKHIVQTHSDIKHCALCGKIFATVKVLLDHLHQYHTEKHVKCQICFKIQKKYKTSLLLLEHMIECHNPYSSVCKKPKQKPKRKPKSYQCTVCRRQFRTKKMVTHHRMMIHHIIPDEAIGDFEGYIKVNCSMFSFARRQHILDYHIGKDTKCMSGPQNTKCTFRKMTKTRANSVRAAKLRLNFTKYCYKCRYCNSGSEDREIMKTHLKYSHSKTQTYGKYENSIMPRLKLFCCKLCPAVFHEWRGYVVHMKSEFSHQHCEICLKRNPMKGVRDRYNIPLHRDRKHGILLVCPKAIESFDDKQSYENHKLQRHYYCNICDVVSCSQNEYKTHKKMLHKDTVSVCEHCGKEYIGSNSLYNHKHLCSKLIKSKGM